MRVISVGWVHMQPVHPFSHSGLRICVFVSEPLNKQMRPVLTTFRGSESKPEPQWRRAQVFLQVHPVIYRSRMG